MRTFRLALALCLFSLNLLLASCASTGGPVSLQEVREFADASARLGGYAELSRRYRDTYQREQPYLPASSDRLARENDARRRAVYEDFVSVQKAVVLYMQTLSLLAGDTRYDLTERIDDLGNGLKANAESGLQQGHIAAYTGDRVRLPEPQRRDHGARRRCRRAGAAGSDDLAHPALLQDQRE
jgi:hypothetical protein